MEKRTEDSGNLCERSLFDPNTLNKLTQLNLDNEGSFILQEMLEAIQIALQKCTQLEEIIMKRNSEITLKSNVLKPPCATVLPSNVSNERDSKIMPTVTEVIEEPQMPMPIVIKSEKIDSGFEHNNDGSKIELNISGLIDPCPQRNNLELPSVINKGVHCSNDIPQNYIGSSEETVSSTPVQGLFHPLPTFDKVCCVSPNINRPTSYLENYNLPDSRTPPLFGSNSGPYQSDTYIQPHQHPASTPENALLNFDSNNPSQYLSNLTAFVCLDVIVTSDELEELFKKEGLAITSIKVKSRPGHTFAFMTFLNEDHFLKCLYLNKKLTLKGKIVLTRHCEPPRKSFKQGSEKREKSHPRDSNPTSSHKSNNSSHRTDPNQSHYKSRGNYDKESRHAYKSRDTYDKESRHAHSSQSRRHHPYHDSRDRRHY